MPKLPLFRERYPKVVVEMLVSERTSNLVEEGIDLAIRNGPLADSSLIARQIGVSAIIAVASTAYLERKGEPKRPSDLDDHDPLMQVYHDHEWGVPIRDARMMWEMLMLEGFQAGLAWIIVLRKRGAFRKAFANFDPAEVARYGERDILRLMAAPGIIRARAKIEATIRGAQIYCEMADRGETFSDFCWSFTDGKTLQGDGKRWIASSPLSERISKELKKKGFKFVGPTIVYAWMQAVGIANDHATGCFRREQVIHAER